MPLESATFINQLDASNPVGTDLGQLIVPELRLLKQVLLNTFPIVDGPIRVTMDSARGSVPVGGIIFWSGAANAIPTNYALCNGQTVARSDGSGNIVTPDLRNRFMVGAGDTYAVGAIGGTLTNTHAVTTTPVTLSQAQLPDYTLPVTEAPHAHPITDPGHTHSGYVTCASRSAAGGGPYPFGADGPSNVTTATTGITIASAKTNLSVNLGGGGQAHNHPASCDTQDNRPPYYALCMIMRV